jgi:hypothetical protein
MEKKDSLYSNIIHMMNVIPIRIVRVMAMEAFFIWFLEIMWWDVVINTPDDARRIVFNRGMWMGMRGLIPRGGHLLPRLMSGNQYSWMNDQNNLTNSRISDRMKIIREFFIKVWINFVCFPR